MLIKFKKPDPRAGMTARMDSSRGQQLVDAGSADLVPEGASVPSIADGRAALDSALRELPGEYDDPDYVVGAMRSHFGDIFTASDEAKVRELVVTPQGPAVNEQAAVEITENAEVQEPAPVLVVAPEAATASKPARGKK